MACVRRGTRDSGTQAAPAAAPRTRMALSSAACSRRRRSSAWWACSSFRRRWASCSAAWSEGKGENGEIGAGRGERGRAESRARWLARTRCPEALAARAGACRTLSPITLPPPKTLTVLSSAACFRSSSRRASRSAASCSALRRSSCSRSRSRRAADTKRGRVERASQSREDKEDSARVGAPAPPQPGG